MAFSFELNFRHMIRPFVTRCMNLNSRVRKETKNLSGESPPLHSDPFGEDECAEIYRN